MMSSEHRVPGEREVNGRCDRDERYLRTSQGY
jgi:hypothetical protein